MNNYDIYGDIATRTNGEIYIGVVGPVRTGKSTFIKNFMNLAVIPNIKDEYKRQRAMDELPQSSNGKTIMTTEPKFVPNEAIEISVGDTRFNMRMIDCVGYLTKNVVGHMEGDTPRMVNTPWSDKQIPFEEAAEIGTKKVIDEHSTVGVVVTTDGSVTELSREDYLVAEERVIVDLKNQYEFNLKDFGKIELINLKIAQPKKGCSKNFSLEQLKEYKLEGHINNSNWVYSSCYALTYNAFGLQFEIYFPIYELELVKQIVGIS